MAVHKNGRRRTFHTVSRIIYRCPVHGVENSKNQPSRCRSCFKTLLASTLYIPSHN